MTFNYTALRDNTAEPLIERFGKDATLSLSVATSDSEPWNPQPDGSIETTVRVVQTQFSLKDRVGTLIQEDDLMFLISTDGDPDVTLAKTLTVESTTYQIANVMPLKPGPVTMLWKAHCRK